MAKKIEDYIITIPDFPKPGIMFRDVTGVLDSGEGLQLSIDELYKLLVGVDFDVIAGAEARGFIFGMPLAYKACKPFVPVRKKGKLPAKLILRPTTSNTARLPSKSTRILSSRVKKWCLLTT